MVGGSLAKKRPGGQSAMPRSLTLLAFGLFGIVAVAWAIMSI
jgi:hypothetical protein